MTAKKKFVIQNMGGQQQWNSYNFTNVCVLISSWGSLYCLICDFGCFFVRLKFCITFLDHWSKKFYKIKMQRNFASKLSTVWYYQIVQMYLTLSVCLVNNNDLENIFVPKFPLPHLRMLAKTTQKLKFILLCLIHKLVQ